MTATTGTTPEAAYQRTLYRLGRRILFWCSLAAVAQVIQTLTEVL
jgi:hypothetical protein